LLVALALDVGKTGNYLDLSCGPGQHARELCDYNPSIHVYGVDISRDMLARACETPCPNTTFVRAAAQELPFEDGFFDGIYCLGAMYLYQDRASVLSEVRRVLKPGARFVSVDFSEPGTGFRGQAIRRAMKLMNVNFTHGPKLYEEFQNQGFRSILVREIGPLIVSLVEKDR
jgi:ubiquinone/menaquinone biosynthesis C-methylase UbiE